MASFGEGMKIVPINKCVSSGQSGKHSFRCKLSTKCYITTKKVPKIALIREHDVHLSIKRIPHSLTRNGLIYNLRGG